MATNFSRVSLGFAEFVSQLIHETFDAILDSQNYQLDKYQEIEDAYNTPTNLFSQNYISEDELIIYVNSFLGFIPTTNTQLTKENIALLESLMREESFEKSVKKNLLTDDGLQLLKELALNKLVETKKAKLKAMLSRPELARLMVDSGEIKAKLELFCLNETESDDSSPPEEDLKTKRQSLPELSKTNFDIKAIKIDKAGKTVVKEIIDNQSQLRTLLIDRSNILKRTDQSSTIPSVRMVANPVSSSSSNLFSEVSIKFKSL